MPGRPLGPIEILDIGLLPMHNRKRLRTKMPKILEDMVREVGLNTFTFSRTLNDCYGVHDDAHVRVIDGCSRALWKDSGDGLGRLRPSSPTQSPSKRASSPNSIDKFFQLHGPRMAENPT